MIKKLLLFASFFITLLGGTCFAFAGEESFNKTTIVPVYNNASRNVEISAITSNRKIEEDNFAAFINIDPEEDSLEDVRNALKEPNKIFKPDTGFVEKDASTFLFLGYAIWNYETPSQDMLNGMFLNNYLLYSFGQNTSGAFSSIDGYDFSSKNREKDAQFLSKISSVLGCPVKPDDTDVLTYSPLTFPLWGDYDVTDLESNRADKIASVLSDSLNQILMFCNNGKKFATVDMLRDFLSTFFTSYLRNDMTFMWDNCTYHCSFDEDNLVIERQNDSESLSGDNKISVVYRMLKGYNKPNGINTFEDNSKLFADILSTASSFEGTNGVYLVDAQYVSLFHCIMEADAYYQKGITAENKWDLTQGLEEKEGWLVGIFKNLLSSIKNAFGLETMDQLVFNKGTRGTNSYFFGLMPTSWTGVVTALFSLCLVIALSVATFGMVKSVMELNMASALPSMRKNAVDLVKDVIVTIIAIIGFFPIFYLAMSLMYKLTNVFRDWGSVNGVTSLNNSRGASSGLAGMVLQFAWFFIDLYMNFQYILRSLFCVLLIGLAPVFLIAPLFGEKGYAIRRKWFSHLVCNLVMQLLHSVVYAVFLRMSNSASGFMNMVFAFSFIPLTQFMRSLITDTEDVLGRNAGALTGTAAAAIGAVSSGAGIALAGGGSTSGGSGGGKDRLTNINDFALRKPGNVLGATEEVPVSGAGGISKLGGFSPEGDSMPQNSITTSKGNKIVSSGNLSSRDGHFNMESSKSAGNMAKKATAWATPIANIARTQARQGLGIVKAVAGAGGAVALGGSGSPGGGAMLGVMGSGLRDVSSGFSSIPSSISSIRDAYTGSKGMNEQMVSEALSTEKGCSNFKAYFEKEEDVSFDDGFSAISNLEGGGDMKSVTALALPRGVSEMEVNGDDVKTTHSFDSALASSYDSVRSLDEDVQKEWMKNNGFSNIEDKRIFNDDNVATGGSIIAYSSNNLGLTDGKKVIMDQHAYSASYYDAQTLKDRLDESLENTKLSFGKGNKPS